MTIIKDSLSKLLLARHILNTMTKPCWNIRIRSMLLPYVNVWSSSYILSDEHLHRKIIFHSLPNILYEYWEVHLVDKKIKYALCLWKHIASPFDITRQWNPPVILAEIKLGFQRILICFFTMRNVINYQTEQNTRLHWWP